jgi:phage tail-like protein
VAKYGNVLYGNNKYGELPALDYSVDPMSVVVLSFSSVEVNWQQPIGEFSRIRLIRNQQGFPEHSEDGVIIWEEFATEGTVTRGSYVDGEENPTQTITNGRPIFYAMYLYTADDTWVLGGTVEDVVPSDHGVHKTLLNLLPKVYVSKEQSPLSVVDEASVLYNFLEGFSFTFEQFLTAIDLIRPDRLVEGTPSTLLEVQERNVGLDPEPTLSVRNQKRLIREAFFLYANKGTKIGLETYVEALTGYAPSVILSSNLLLNVQDSTFYNSIGNWTATNATITASTAQTPTTSSPNQMDNLYTCSVVASSSGVMSLGTSLPITKKIPVTSGKTYIASAGIKRPTGSGTITPTVKYYDRDNTLLYSKSGTAASAGNAWSVTSVSALVPAYQLKSISGAVGAAGNIVYTTTAAHSWVVGSIVSITGFTTTAVNLTDVVITAVTGTTFTVANAYTGTATGSGQVRTLEGCYAAIELAYSTSGTYYIDEVCLQEGSSVNYEEARAISVQVAPNKINYIKNPSFEVDSSTWTVTGATFSQDSSVPIVGYPGSYSGKFVAAGAWSIVTNYEIPITAGQYYTASAYIKALAATSVDLKIKFYDDADALVTTAIAEDVAITTSFTRVSVTGLSDSTSEATYAIFEVIGTAATVYVDLVQFEKTSSPTEYLDGSMPTEFGVIWLGTANASYSYQYFSKETKMPRLAQTLGDWMPPNTFWALSTPVSIEYTSLTV